MLLSLPAGKADGVIIVPAGDFSVGSQGPNVLQALQSAALRHIHHAVYTQPGGGPGDSPSVIAVGGGDKGQLAQLLPHGWSSELVVSQLGYG